jgi:hypothetical protein
MVALDDGFMHVSWGCEPMTGPCVEGCIDPPSVDKANIFCKCIVVFN